MLHGASCAGLYKPSTEVTPVRHATGNMLQLSLQSSLNIYNWITGKITRRFISSGYSTLQKETSVNSNLKHCLC